MTYQLYGNEANDFMALVTYHNYTMIELYYQLLADLESGNEKRALSIVYEMVDTGYAKYAFKFLKRYAAKEIGVSNPMAFILTKSAAEAWGKDKAAKAQGGKADRHYLALSVQYLTRIKKNPVTKNLVKQVDRDRLNDVHFAIDESVKEQAKQYMLRSAEELDNHVNHR